ncbi:hypothetical protein Poli38472_006309 [Pythium oligandrum]|uniref:Ion transport domain-containing protein n=1 Tax=Pythium oligandrum TaxID=41045 RepID=A0A8K1CS56_PYTOL|nr:hypothetical protein Poli38472_006309 [Pythium oligandrum]|eukprot:TMW68841.1 hypothetical protein Poli38472_006309 [Pythium oligandrum]
MAKGGVKYTRVAVSSAPRRGQHVGCREHVLTIASRLYFSNFYRLIYFFTVVASLVCVVWTGLNDWKIPNSVVFISLEIAVSALLVFEVALRMMAFRTRFWSKWSNIFDLVALTMSLVSVAMYFNEEGVIGELEEVATDTLLALRNALQYVRLAIFLKNRSEQIGSKKGADMEIDFDSLPTTEEDTDEEEENAVLMAELGLAKEEEDDAFEAEIQPR